MVKKLKDFKIHELHLYMKFRSFTGKTGEIIKLEKYNNRVDSSRDPDFIITIKWEDGKISETEYEMNCEIEYIEG